MTTAVTVKVPLGAKYMAKVVATDTNATVAQTTEYFVGPDQERLFHAYSGLSIQVSEVPLVVPADAPPAA